MSGIQKETRSKKRQPIDLERSFSLNNNISTGTLEIILTKEEVRLNLKEKPTTDGVKKKKKMGRPMISQDRLCIECGKEFPRRSYKDVSQAFKRHLLKHQVENFSCECPGLPKVFIKPGQERVGKDFRQKERHMKVEHLGWLGCQECIKCLENQEELTKHVKKHKQLFYCDLCAFVAQNREALKHHSKTKHDTGDHHCPECEKVFNSSFALNKHIPKVHRASACRICGAVLKNMKLHMQERHIDDADKKYHCEDCGKGFMDKQRMNDHRMNIHIKSQPHKCRYGCENRYNSPSNRNAHEKRNHRALYREKHARNSICPICGAALKNMNLHMQDIHMNDADKKYHCEDCGKGFLDEQRMNGHIMNVHMKSQSHKCRYGCQNSYSNTSNRNAHEKRNQGDLYRENHE